MPELTPELTEAIKTAIQLEKDGQKFFLEAAEKAENDLAKKLFKTLAAEEVSHLRTFKKLFDAVMGGKDWKELFPERPPRERAKIFIKEGTPTSPAVGSGDEVTALGEAMSLEKQAIEFFQQASDKAHDPKAKEIFDRIREEEEYHYDLLQAQLDAVTNSGFWFDVNEISLEGMY